MITDEKMIGMMSPEFRVQHFDMLQNDDGETVALYIARPETEEPLAVGHPGRTLVENYAESARLPLFLIRFALDYSWQDIMPVNCWAREIMPETTRTDEADWSAFVKKCLEQRA